MAARQTTSTDTEPAPSRSAVTQTRNARLRSSPAILPGRVRAKEFSRIDYQLTLKEDELMDDVFAPLFFGAKADVLTKGDRITVVSHDCAEWCELLVFDVDPKLRSVRTVPLFGPIDLSERIRNAPQFDLSLVQPEQSGGPEGLWRLRIGSQVVASGFVSRVEAIQHLDELRQGRKASDAPQR